MTPGPWKPFLRSMGLESSAPTSGYPFDLPAIAGIDDLEFGPVTIFVGENGSGKSTIVEALATTAGFNAEGGSTNLRFTTHATHSDLGTHLKLRWRQRPSWGWFLRAETFYGMATHITRDTGEDGLAGYFPNLHGNSHGESFLSLIGHRFADRGFYVMDEPESALSFQGQLQLLRVIHDGIGDGSQYVIATHSPLLMRMPGATIYELGVDGIHRRDYEDLSIVNLWRRFLEAPDRLLETLFADDE
jgi:predicted ATPase